MIARTQALGAAPGDSKSPPVADVCVVIPTYRRPEILKIAIDSILAQEDLREAVELVIVDNDPGRSAEDCVTKFGLSGGEEALPDCGGMGAGACGAPRLPSPRSFRPRKSSRLSAAARISRRPDNRLSAQHRTALVGKPLLSPSNQE
jgi:hypothetical protein